MCGNVGQKGELEGLEERAKASGDYKQSDATGFINIYGLPTKVQAIVNNEKEGK